MKRNLAIVGAAVVALVVIGGGVSAAAQAPGPSARTVTTAVARADTAAAEADGWTVASSEGSAVPQGGRVVAAAPHDVVPIQVSLDQTSIEQYWMWASGVEVTAHGMTPGATATISITFASGLQKHWAPITADADGSIVTRVRTLDVDPENTQPEPGVARITVDTSTGEAGSALLDITVPDGERLKVWSDPASITQDEFLDKTVVVHASGFAPMTHVFFNLGMPDTTMVAIGENEGLHSDENGDFSYEMQMVSVNALVGEWLISLQSADGTQQGSGTFMVTPGAPRTQNKTLTPSAPQISAAAFATAPGMAFDVTGFIPFDTYELTLVTSRGIRIPLGISRTNGEGRHHNSVKAPDGAAEGVYTLEARSTITGDYALGTFTVTGNPDSPASSFALTPSTVAARVLSDPAGGIVVTGAAIPSGTSLRVSLRDAQWKRMPLTVGADAYADAGEDGTIRMPLVTLDPIAAGSYTVWITAGSAPFGYSIQLPLMVTAESSAAPSADIAPSSGASSSAVAPAPSSPLVAITPSTTTPRVDRPAPPAPSAAPSPSPSPDVDPLEGDVAPPALPVPTSPAR
ncbi:hypothetical protein [Microbacterium sp. PM5]|uniref:hypothetical protein n=1 Tax=Microbacterium sp. PM5 TaxID=2014534 RepID=UPI0013AF8944|nr:hypothetical protein [Microbacterium sp. PM5]